MTERFSSHNTSYPREPIAIIGIGCRFPGQVESPDDYWNLLVNGVDAITPVPTDRWDVKAFYDPNPTKAGKMHVNQGGFLSHVDQFDAQFFGISPREADNLDPQQRLLLEVAWDALEDANLVPGTLAGKDVGVFVGAFTLDYKILQFQEREEVGTHTAVGSMMTMISARLAYIFDFVGPCLSVDTACSSSLVSVHLACKSLWDGECEMALAGGINVMTTPDYTIAEAKGGFLSPDARSKAFDVRANGYVRGEGAGLIVLKPLSKALANQDPIYALIRGTAVNQDGHTKGITVPNQSAQEKLMRKAYAHAGVIPGQVQYLEAHGTGTPVGDPIEARAIAAVMADGRTANAKCIVGSCKTNIGHLEAAAGIAGLIKATLCLKNRTIPPHLHFQTPNPEIPFDTLGIRIPTQTEPWPQTKGPALAGVNAFGFGGTNAHIVLEEAPTHTKTVTAVFDQPETETKPVRLFPLSARSPEALKAMAQTYHTYLTEKVHDEAELTNLLYTLSQHRTHHDHRLVLVGHDRDTYLSQLAAFLADEPAVGVLTGRVIPGQRHKLVFVYTGMGPQWWAMGRQLLAAEPVFRQAVEKCDAVFQKYAGWSILEAMLVSEEQSEMAETRVAQPGNVVVQIGLTELWRSWGIEPDAMVGHSVGEIVSGYVSGMMTLEETMQVAYHRSRLQQLATDKGKMLAVALSEEKAIIALNGHEKSISLAAINSPYSVTLAGDADVLAELGRNLDTQEIFNKILYVKIPYHSPHMDPLKDELVASLHNLSPQPAKKIIYSTVTGELAEPDAFTADYWWRNVRYPVRFAQAITRLAQEGYDTFLEVGPHPVLSASINECLAKEGITTGQTYYSIRRNRDEQQTILETLGTLYTHGYPLAWQNLNNVGQAIRLPRYAWQRERYWHEAADAYQSRINQQEHPLLRKQLKTPCPTWEGEISTYHLPYLQDHVVQNAVLFPGAGYVELGLVGAKKAYNSEQCVLEQVKFHQALFMHENDSPQIQLHLDEQTAMFSVYSRSLGSKENWRFNASGYLRQLANANLEKRVVLSDLLAVCPETLTAELCYAEFAQKGFQYGPAFQGIMQLWRGTYDAVGQVSLPETERAMSVDYQIHPALLDSCFQTMVAIDSFAIDPETNTKQAFLPIGIDRIAFYAKPQHTVWAHAHIVAQNAQKVVGNISVFDENGRLLVDIQGFTAQVIRDAQAVTVTELDKWLYEMAWQPQSRLDDAENRRVTVAASGTWILFVDKTGVGHAAAKQLTKKGYTCILVDAGEYDTSVESGSHYQVDPTKITEIQQLLTEIVDKAESPIQGLVYFWALDVPASAAMTSDLLAATQTNVGLTVMYIMKSIAQLEQKPTLWLITQGAQPVARNLQEMAVGQAPLWGLGRVIGHQEHVTNWGGLIDLDPIAGSEQVPLLVDEILAPDAEDQIAFRGQDRYVVRLTHSTGHPTALPPQFHANASYLITGGLGALGLLVAQWMIVQGARRLILLSRSALPPRRDWHVLAHTHPFYQRVKTIQQLEAMGAAIHVASVDVTNETELVHFVKTYHAEGWPAIRGIVHSAGIVQDHLLTEMDDATFNGVIAPKTVGAWALHKTFAEQPLDFFILFSSVASLVAQTGQSNYASGNAFLDTLAYYRQAHGLPAISINWGPWAVGMIRDLDLIEHYARRGMDAISAEAGTQLLTRLFGFDRPQVGVVSANWPTVLEYYPRIPQQVLHLGEEAEVIAANNKQTLSLEKQLRLAEPEEQQKILEDALRQLAARVLRMKQEQLETNIPLNSLGMDSLIATELRNRMELNLGVTVSVVDLLQGPTITQLVDKALTQLTATQENQLASLLDSEVALSPEAIHAAIQEQDQESILDLLDNLDSLSEEEVAALLAM